MLKTLSDRTPLLFETANPARDPEGLITRFLQYESFRIDREKYELAMVGTVQERLDVLFWYLGKYIRDRHCDYVVPLSARQIAYLNAPVLIAGAPSAVTLVLYNFLVREQPAFLDLDDPAVVSEAVFWWCVEKAPRFKLADRLVTPEQIALLQTVDERTNEPFAFNPFLHYYFDRDKTLQALDKSYARDRGLVFYYVLLRAMKEPWLLRFLPRAGVRRALRETAEAPSLFDQVLARFAFPGGADGLAEARNLRQMGAAIAREAGYTLDAPGLPPTIDTGECYRKTRALDAPVEPGVALVGPLLKASGLAQAARLSLAILTAVEPVRPTALVFDLDNPAPLGFSSDIAFAPYRNRREINLLHLNAESIPLAFAFEQREILSSSYNIGYFFWELNMIPKCHYLALDLLDEIWVSSEYNREIYARFTQKPVINVGMAVEDLPDVAPMPRADLGLPDDCTVFLTTFDSFSFIERKNPLGVLEAFGMAFPLLTETVRLVIKTQNRARIWDEYQIRLWKRIDAIVQGDPRIIVINETYQYRDVLALKRACDCYVSLHRSEGWGFGMIEAMQIGLPVICTAYAGNMDFCTPETAYLVGYDLIGTQKEEYIFVERGSHWAKPKLEEAAAHMRSVASDPGAASVKGKASTKHIAANFSVDAIGRRYADRIAQVRSGSADLAAQRI